MRPDTSCLVLEQIHWSIICVFICIVNRLEGVKETGKKKKEPLTNAFIRVGCLGTEPWALNLLGKFSTSELYTHPPYDLHQSRSGQRGMCP